MAEGFPLHVFLYRLPIDEFTYKRLSTPLTKRKKCTIAENRIIKLALITDLGKNWARCLPNWGTVLTHPGHAACPGWAELQSGICPKVNVVTPMFLFPEFCQRIRFLSSEFATSDIFFHQPTIKTVGWQLPGSQLPVCQSITMKNQMVWQFLWNSWFLLKISVMATFTHID